MAGTDNTRKLATILAIDAVGYSANAERDQVGAARGIAVLRDRVAELAAKHDGRIFNTAGDGFMLEFPLASAAVRAAIALVEDAAKPDSGLPSVRAGAHLGEVMIDGADLMGHGVNVAARLVTQAEPNGLVISDALMTQIHGEIDAVFTPLGPIHLSKMRETVQAYAFVAGAAADLGLRRRLTLVARRRWRVLTAGAAALLIVVIAALWLLMRPETYALDRMEIVAHSPRSEFQPTLSPDGRLVVYAVEMGDYPTNIDLFMRTVTGGEETRLTDTPEVSELSPAFSPTGDRLAYIRNIPPRSRRDAAFRPCEIVVRVLPQGLDRQVGACEGAEWTARLAWTPDGRALVYTDNLPGSETARIRILNLDTGEARDVVAPIEGSMGDYNASVSPDGGRVAFVRYRAVNVGDVYVYDSRRQQLTRVTEAEQWAQVAWADSRNLFITTLSSSAKTGTELWLRRADVAGRGQLLLPGLSQLGRPDAVGGLLALEVQTRVENLWRSSNGRSVAVTSGNQVDFKADFSRAGTLAFLSLQSSEWIFLQAPGEQPRRFVELGAESVSSSLRWSPDGRRLLYAADREGRARIFTVDVPSGVIQTVPIAGDEAPGNPRWAPDGRSLVFTGSSAAGTRLLRVSLDGSGVTQPISGYGWAEAIETREGLFAVSQFQPGIWRLAPGRAPELVFAGYRAWETTARYSIGDWTVANGNFYVADRSDPGRTRILSRPITGGSVRRVVDVEGSLAGSLAVDPITGAVVYGVITEEQYDIGIMRFHRE